MTEVKEEFIEATAIFCKMFPRGTKVEILRTSVLGERGWGVSWTSEMNVLVGTIGTVISDNDWAGVNVATADGDAWNFPYFVLKPLKEK